MLEFVARMEQCSPQEAAWRVNDWFTLGHGKKTMPRNRATANQPSGPSPEPRIPRPAPASAAACQTAAKEPAEEETGENAVPGFSLASLDAAHPYLRERGLTPETIAHFGIGHCPEGIMAGRIAIPIHNAAGRIVANAGR